MSQVLRGSLILCLAALNYAVANALVKVLSTLTGFWQISLGRFAVGVIAVPLLALIMGLSLKGRQPWVILIRSVLGTLTFLAMIEAFSRAPLAEAMVLFYLYPVVGALVSPWLVGDRTRPGDWPCLGLGLLGTVLILWRPGQVGLSLGAGHLFALLAALLCGVQLVLIRRLSRDNNPLTIYFYFCLVGGLACVPPLAGQSGPLWPAGLAGWLLLALGGFFALAQILMAKGLQHVPAPQAGPLLMLEVPTTVAFGVFYLGEPLTWRLLLGGALILGASFYVTAWPSRRAGLVSAPSADGPGGPPAGRG